MGHSRFGRTTAHHLPLANPYKKCREAYLSSRGASLKRIRARLFNSSLDGETHAAQIGQSTKEKKLTSPPFNAPRFATKPVRPQPVLARSKTFEGKSEVPKGFRPLNRSDHSGWRRCRSARAHFCSARSDSLACELAALKAWRDPVRQSMT